MVTMMRRTLLMVAMLALGGCEVLTEPKPLEEFEWIGVQNQSEVQEGIDAAVFFGEINLLGQFKTPSLCFNVIPTFGQSGSTLTLRVDAKSTNSANCAQVPGGFRYTGVIRRLGRGTYTLRIIHGVPGQPDKEYSKTVTI